MKLLPTPIQSGLVFSVIFSTFVACTGSKDKGSDTSLKTVAEKGSAWDQKEITICWEIESPETALYRKEVRDLVDSSLKGTVFKFQGWEACSLAKAPDIRIFIYDDESVKNSPEYKSFIQEFYTDYLGKGATIPAEPLPGIGHPRVRAMGKHIKGMRAGLILNRTFLDAQPGTEKIMSVLTPEGQRNLSLSVSLHEFGHALGLGHEDAHPERTCDTFAEDLGDEGMKVSPYNPFSFMSRCYYRNYNYDLGLLLPNKFDIEGLNIYHSHLSH